MILPCRIHRAPNRVDSLSLAVLFAASFLALQPGHTQGQNTTSIPLQITAGVDTGYDDNVIGSGATTSSSGAGSLFTRENVTLSYDRTGQRTEVYLLGIGRFSQFFDLGTDDKNGNVTLSLTH